MATINIHEAKTHLSKLVERATTGEEIVIAKSGKALVRLVPLNMAPEGKNPREAGWGKDLLQHANLDALFDPTLNKEIEDAFYGPLEPES
ncbi:MAG: type II toxin-antitoxin system prevent-host-death family antitoxin [Bryobacteraceae bacterium]|jgi:prevent-host-death family protein